MVRSTFAVLCLVAMFLLMVPGGIQHPGIASVSSAPQSVQSLLAPEKISAAYKNLPLAFEPNQGQTDPRVRFLSHGHGYTVFLADDEAVLEFRNAGQTRSIGHQEMGSILPSTGIVRMKLVNAAADQKASGLEELPGRSNYFVGNDPAKWHNGVPNFARVKYEHVYPGVDLAYYGDQGQLEYDFILKPGANPEAIRFQFAGADLETGATSAPHLDSTGALVADTSAGEVRLHRPVIYQKMDNGQSSRVDGHFRLLAGNEVGFEVGAYDRTRELVIDPVLTYASYLGGSNGDAVNSVSVTVDSAGNAYVASGTLSTDFPIVSAVQPTYGGGPAICDQGDNFCGDAFVTKINPTGTAILYSTYLGGSDTDYAFGLAVDSAGNAYVAGQTKSTNFPVTAGAFQPVYGGSPQVCDEYDCGDIFVTKLNPTGSALVYSSYLGGSGNDHPEALTVDAGGNAYVTGATTSTNFPITPGAFQSQFTGGICTGRSGANIPCGVAYLTKINPTGTALVYSTYLGGSSGDGGGGVVVDKLGRASVGGNTCSTNFPITAGAYQSVAAGGCEVFLSTFNTTGTHLLYSTYFGGTSYEATFSAAVDSSGAVYLSGYTYSTDFPITANAAQKVLAGSSDAFAAKFNPTLSGAASLVYSTYLGGTQGDFAAGVAVDPQGNAYICGQTSSSDFPVVNPLQAALNGKEDVFVTKLNPQGSAPLVYSTFLGGSGAEFADFIAVDGKGNAYVAGWTQSADFPSTPRAFQPSFAGGNTDVFIAKIGPNNGAGVSFTPVSLTFAPQSVGTNSAAQTVVLHNVGSAALTISNISASANFSETNNCGGSVAGGGSCAISVTFTPPSVGTQSGSVTVSDNAGGSPQIIGLSGTGK